MKSITSILLAVAILSITSCKNPADTARIGALTDLALNFAARKKQISAADLADIREAKTIILPTAPAGASPPLGKRPLANLQP